MTPERLEEIREHLAADPDGWESPVLLEDVRDLMAEVERKDAALRAQVKHMVDRFLAWRLPDNFSPDAGISFKAIYNEGTPYEGRHEPTGTNLFDATQAEAMVRHMLDGAALSPPPEPRRTPRPPGRRPCVEAGDDDCDHEPCCFDAPPPPLEAEPTQSEPGRCTCGSGGHPRRCEQHPGAYERHVAEIEDENRAPDPAPEPVGQGKLTIRMRGVRMHDNPAEPRKEPERELDFKTFCTGEPPPHDWDVSAPTAAFCRRCGVYRPYAVRTWTREQIEAALYEAQTDTAGDSTALDESAFWRALEGT